MSGPRLGAWMRAGVVFSRRTKIEYTTADAVASLAESATSYLQDIRLRLAQAVTSSLNSSDRDVLLKSINAVDATKSHEEKGRSVGEAVAAAELRELEVSRAAGEKIRAIEVRAEEAALERIKTEMALHEKMLERASLTSEAAALEATQPPISPITVAAAKAIGVAHTKAGEVGVSEGKVHHHPILGPAVADVGYKRVHIISAAALRTIPIWEKQRVYRHARAKAMASDKMKSLNLGLPGIIALHEAEDGGLSILDGQHRVGMLTVLDEKLGGGTTELDLNRILVEVFPDVADSHNHAQDLFTEINKSEPVKLVDLPGIASSQDLQIINKTAERLHATYRDMFKPSSRCRPPHMNIDNLRDALFASNVLKRHKIKSHKALFAWVLEQNATLAANYDTLTAGDPLPPRVTPAALEKAKAQEFYLGLEASWLYL